MTSIFLTFYQRVLLWNLVGSGQLNSLKEAAPCLRLLEKLRITDEETRITDLKQGPQGLSWQLPMLEYGQKTVELEADEVTALSGILEKMQGVRVADAQWLLQLADQLNGKEPAPTPEPPAAEPPPAAPPAARKRAN